MLRTILKMNTLTPIVMVLLLPSSSSSWIDSRFKREKEPIKEPHCILSQERREQLAEYFYASARRNSWLRPLQWKYEPALNQGKRSSDADPRCQRSLNHAAGNLGERSLCPWATVRDFDQMRIPSTIMQFPCICLTAPGTAFECENVYMKMTAGRFSEDCQNITIYEERIAVGCVTVKPATRKLDLPPVLNVVDEPRVEN